MRPTPRRAHEQRIEAKALSDFLCVAFVFSVPLWESEQASVNHRDTKVTKDPQSTVIKVESLNLILSN